MSKPLEQRSLFPHLPRRHLMHVADAGGGSAGPEALQFAESGEDRGNHDA